VNARRLSLAIWWLAICSLVTGSVIACKVPVFRYALERWAVDRYRMVAIVNGEQDPAIGKLLANFEAIGKSNANIDIELIDLATLSEEEFWQLEEFDDSLETPRLQVFYPEKDGRRIKCWEGALTAESISQWLDSPLRREIVNDIVTGGSAVFLLIDGSEAAQNEQIASQLREALAAATEQIEIPSGVIARGEANQYLVDHPEATMDDVLRSDVPLKVEFPLRRLARDDATESGLLAMVQGLVEETEEPILVPIFGRGRMLDAMNATECDDDVILNVCRYMVGECSCTVKALNPGVDLILTVNWSEKLGQSVVMVDRMPSGEPTFVTIPTGGDAEEKSEVTLIGQASSLWRLLIPFVAAGIVFCLIFVLRKSVMARR